MFQLTDIDKAFTDGTTARTVLSGLSLTVRDGEFVAIKGESGAGKSTLLSVIGTLLRPDRGTYLLDGKDITPYLGGDSAEVAAIRNRDIGIVFQDHRLLPQFTAMQNILLPSLATNRNCPQETMDRAEELMAFMGIADIKDSMAEVLSGGEKARVAICRALIMSPRMLLADEPTGQLDSDNSQTIATLFRKINSELGTMIVMVTHSDAMAGIAHKCYTLRAGRLECETTA